MLFTVVHVVKKVVEFKIVQSKTSNMCLPPEADKMFGTSAWRSLAPKIEAHKDFRLLLK